jgi:hypothetical protein
MSGNLLTFRLNTYFATLIITIFGAGASLLIINIANADIASADFMIETSQYGTGAYAKR